MKKHSKTWLGFTAYLKYVWKEKKSLYLMGLLFFPAFIVANYLQIYLPKMVIMELEEKRSIWYLGLSTLLLILILMECNLVRVKMLSRIQYGNRMLTMQNDFAKKQIYVDYRYLEDQDFLSLRNKTKKSLFGGSIGDVQEYGGLRHFIPTLLMILASGGNILLYVYYICKLSPWLVLVLAVLPCYVLIVNRSFQKNEKAYAEKNADSWQKMDYVTRKTEDFTMAKDVRLYQMDQWFNGLIKGFCKEGLFYKGKELKVRFRAGVLNTIAFGIFQGCFFGCVLYRLGKENLGVSDVVFYAGMGPALYHMLCNDFASKIILLMKISIEFGRFNDYMKYGEDTGNQEVPIKEEAPVITLEHVSFSYPESENRVLNDLNISIRAGEKIAVVGVNGAGKTTLMKLLCGLLHPTSGRILLNGIDMEDMEAEERYAQFSCAFQDIQFLPLSIRENISMEISNVEEDYEKNDERIWACLGRAGIKEEIKALPKQLDTLMEKDLNEDATDFSGGQRQKLILARALYRNAGALILDEPTAALDALAENEVYEKYAGFAKEKTSFFVSHRLSSTRFCDRILLIDGGTVAEEGTHEELLAFGGLYAKMFAMQSKYYKGGQEE